MRSSVSGAASYRATRSRASSSGSTGIGPLPGPAPTGRKYDTGVEGLLKVPSLGGRRSRGQDLSTILAGASYMEAASSLASEQGIADEEPIRSLVPAAPGMYREIMLKADRAFRRGEYQEAANQFRYANHLASRNPESLLGMAHAMLATGSYSTAAWHLKEAIRYFPELPLARLDPAGFYASDPESPADRSVQYRQHRLSLEEYVKRNSYDANGHLVLAYLLWFEDRPDETKANLARALKEARENPSSMNMTGMALADPTVEAIETFWRAMKVSGKVSGSLEPPSQPATGPARD